MAVERQTELEHFQALEATLTKRLYKLDEQITAFGKRDAPTHMLVERDDINRELQRIKKEILLLTPREQYDTPYLGLSTFQKQHAEFFYGRDELIAQLVEKAKEQRFLAILGPSGSGKSSVVLAGLLPSLKAGKQIEGSDSWRQLIIRPESRPMDVLAAELTKLQGGDVGTALALSRQLAESDRALLLAADMLIDHRSNQRLVLVVDQAEELWTLTPTDSDARATYIAQQQRPFIQLLVTAASAADSPLLIVLTMRADFLHRAAEHRDLAQAIGDHLVLVSPMTTDELRSAIEQPALKAGGSFEPGLVEELIDQVDGRPGYLPLLQFTLFELWQERRSDGTMTWERFLALGGVKGALANRADSMLAEHYKAPEVRNKLRTALLRLVHLGETADTRRRVHIVDIVPADDTVENIYALLKPLIDARLLTAGYDARELATVGSTNGDHAIIVPDKYSQMTIELSHEALIAGWPTMKQWIDDARDDLQIQLRLGAAAKEWQANSENPEFLWTQARLAIVDAWHERSDTRLTGSEASFLSASRIESKRVARERQTTQWLRYLRQAGGVALGAGLGYGLAVAYLAAAENAGPLLIGTIERTAGALALAFLALFLPGALVGFSIGLVLWRWSADPVRRLVATTGVGTVMGLICYAPFVILSQGSQAFTSNSALPHFTTGALLGVALGLGSGLARHKRWRFAVIFSVSILAGVVSYLIGGFAEKTDIFSAAIAGGIIGSLTGLGLYMVAID